MQRTDDTEQVICKNAQQKDRLRVMRKDCCACRSLTLLGVHKGATVTKAMERAVEYGVPARLVD